MEAIPFSQLEGVSLTTGIVYEGGCAGNISDDPLAKLLKGGNTGSYRYCGSLDKINYLIITLSPNDQQWPDVIESDSGTIFCFGDNKTPEYTLNSTPRNGNLILKTMFKGLGNRKNLRIDIPPVFVFCKHPNKTSPRSIRFIGLCAPGSPELKTSKNLVRVQRQVDTKRFSNYRATFTVLDIPEIKRAWIEDLEAGIHDSKHRPIVWKMWQKSGLYRPLLIKNRQRMRTSQEQLPTDDLRKALLFKIYRHFSAMPYQFLHFAAELYALTDKKISLGRAHRFAEDSTYMINGKYRLGLSYDPYHITFGIEARCYDPGIGNRKRKSVGEKEVLKVISRLEERQYGVLMTTSVITRQAYQIAKRQIHPLVCLSGLDMVDILISTGINSVVKLNGWLVENYTIKT